MSHQVSGDWWWGSSSPPYPKGTTPRSTTMKRTIGVQWQPIPVSLCAELCKLRHTPANPAPRAVVYAWCWHMLHQNADISIREVANYAGWSRWKAEQIRRLVVADIQAWKVKPDDSSHHARQNQTRSSHQTNQNQIVTNQNQTPNQTIPDRHRTITRVLIRNYN